MNDENTKPIDANNEEQLHKEPTQKSLVSKDKGEEIMVNEGNISNDSFEDLDRPHCEKHPKYTFSMYCFDCNDYFCPACFALERHNPEHTYFYEDQLKSKMVQQIFITNQKLKNYMNKIDTKLKAKADLQIKNITEQKESQLAYLQKMTTILEKTYSELLEKIEKAKDKLDHEKDDLDDKQQNLTDVLKEISKNSDKNNVENKKTEEELQKITDDATNEANISLKKCKKTNNILGCSMSNIKIINEPAVFEFEIDNYLDIINKRNPKYEMIKSPKFRVNFFEWYFKVYPWGDGEAKDKFLSAYIVLDECKDDVDYLYEYKLELVNFQELKEKEQQNVKTEENKEQDNNNNPSANNQNIPPSGNSPQKENDNKENENVDEKKLNEENNVEEEEDDEDKKYFIQKFRKNHGWGKIDIYPILLIENDGFLSDKGSIVIRCTLQSKSFDKEIDFCNEHF